ncbi:universal stress protein [Sedimentitalea sp. CY04]|uniref:Universal stress protein n=1 Tax=Parasedimentitalea denitrificans TaxID=2211118 RepID=A0ABX0W9I7_9RHOB|nr:universal stress protein [Sedimentitalea sp. CY04]NIZ61340.1 universal stress protein [Sedimentitalea sp. CY04]
MYKHILIPVLFDDRHDTQASYLAARALADDDAKFTVVHVMESIPSYVTAEIPSEVLTKTRNEVEKALNQSARALPGAEALLISGHAGRAIVDFADESDVDCIVLASHRPGFEDLFLGSTAARVVRHAKCSVHVIR